MESEKNYVVVSETVKAPFAFPTKHKIAGGRVDRSSVLNTVWCINVDLDNRDWGVPLVYFSALLSNGRDRRLIGYIYSIDDRAWATGNGEPGMQITTSHILGVRYIGARILICWASLPSRGTMTAAEILIGLAMLYGIVVLIWQRHLDE